MITNAPRSVRMFPLRDCVKDDGFPMPGQSAHRTGAVFSWSERTSHPSWTRLKSLESSESALASR